MDDINKKLEKFLKIGPSRMNQIAELISDVVIFLDQNDLLNEKGKEFKDTLTGK